MSNGLFYCEILCHISCCEILRQGCGVMEISFRYVNMTRAQAFQNKQPQEGAGVWTTGLIRHIELQSILFSKMRMAYPIHTQSLENFHPGID